MRPPALDCLVVGGGIAGFWLLDRLVSAGYRALLVERERLGAGQTIAAQGIIHGGMKYALGGLAGEASRALADAPERWRRALAGDGDVDLRPLLAAAPATHLWLGEGLAGRLLAAGARAGLAGVVQPLSPEDWPAALRGRPGIGQVLRLDEPVLDVPALLALLARRHEGRILRAVPVALAGGSVVLAGPDRRRLALRAARVFVLAGSGAEELAGLAGARLATQRRPLHMLMAKGALPELFGHALGLSDKPLLTVTSHRARDGAPVWYLGGGLAEDGVAMAPAALIAAGRARLAGLLEPSLIGRLRFATLRIDRAEARGAAGARPSDPLWQGDGPVIFGFPSKLALAPRLADMALDGLAAAGLRPSGPALPDLPAGWPAPELADPPWEMVTWS
ncbi:MAG: hypothetical protein KIT81_08795 [Alphaproteobacteria bacterium]|nr:hypothetical protein [Alphaproteobacteria bacterium]